MTDPRREQRVRRLSLAVTALLLPVAFVVSSWHSLKDYVRGQEFIAKRALQSSGAPYAGATWRLAGLKIIAGSVDRRLDMPPDRALVLVRLSAIVTRDIGEGWFVCRFTLLDRGGRHWAPLSVSFPKHLERLIEPDGQAAPGCGSVALARPTAGSSVVIEEKFLVPRTALATLAARFSVSTERPVALVFPLQTP